MADYRIATRKIEVSDLVFQECRTCGEPHAPHPHEMESCLTCQIHWMWCDLRNPGARLWEDLLEEEHEPTRDFMVRDMALLRELRGAL